MRFIFEQSRSHFEQSQPNFEQLQPHFEQSQPNFEQTQLDFEQLHPIFEQSHFNFEQLHPIFEQSPYMFEQILGLRLIMSTAQSFPILTPHQFLKITSNFVKLCGKILIINIQKIYNYMGWVL
ncbi:hypothetical protein ACLIA0_10570 [Bacillaceae bacterium W0354]